MSSFHSQQSPSNTNTASNQYQPPQPSWWNTGLGLGTGSGSGSAARRNSCMFTTQDDSDDRIMSNNNQYSYPETYTANTATNLNRGGSLNGNEVPIIHIDSGGNMANGYVHQNNNTSGSSPTHPSNHSPTQPFYRGRANSSISAARNKLRIMAMLDDVRKKRELRDRRKSDIMAYLDDLMGADDPAMANAAAGALKVYRRRFKIYQFLNHPSTGTPWSITYHVMVFVIVFVCLILTICATIQQAPLQEKAIKSVAMLEKVVVVWFNIEFCLGLWSCACKKRYRGYMGKVRYLTVPSRLIDLVILSFTTIVLIFNPSKTGHEVFVVSTFRGFHRFFQVAQVLTLNRPLKPWKVLASVIYDQREQLFIIYYTEFIVLCVLAYVAFLVERDSNENFNSIADAMWWAIVTLSTVGYGDRVPVTWVGKIISTLFTILGVAIFALPAGIIGTGLALKIEEVERNQIRNRKKVAAAILIQRAYRSWKAHQTYELVSKFFRERPMPIYKQHDYLSMAHKFIALVQFYIALNKFRELLRPLDLKTVMQSYSDGQTEVLLRTKLVQQSIEELTRRVEMTENRIGNMSMRIETKQNTFERRIDHIRQLMESCHRQLLANHLLVELLRTSYNHNNRANTMTANRRFPKQTLSTNYNNNNNKQPILSNNNNRPKMANPVSTAIKTNAGLATTVNNASNKSNAQPTNTSNMPNNNSNNSNNNNSSSSSHSSNNATPPRPNNLPIMQIDNNLYPIISSGSNTSVDESDEDLSPAPANTANIPTIPSERNQGTLKKLNVPTQSTPKSPQTSSSVNLPPLPPPSSSSSSSSTTLLSSPILPNSNVIQNDANNHLNNCRGIDLDGSNQRCHYSPNPSTQPSNPYRARRMSL